MDAWINLLSTGGVGVILAWYLYHSTTTTIPLLQSGFQKSLDKVVEDFRAELTEERAARERLQVSSARLARALRKRPCLLRKPRPDAPVVIAGLGHPASGPQARGRY